MNNLAVKSEDIWRPLSPDQYGRERLPLFRRVEHDVPSYLLVVTWVRRVRLEFECHWPGCLHTLLRGLAVVRLLLGTIHLYYVRNPTIVGFPHFPQNSPWWEVLTTDTIFFLYVDRRT